MSAANAIGAAGVATLLLAFLPNLNRKLNPSSPLDPVRRRVGGGLSCHAFWIIGFLPPSDPGGDLVQGSDRRNT